MSAHLLIQNASQIVRVSGNKSKCGKDMNELSVIEDGAIWIKNGIIEKVDTTTNLQSDLIAEKIDLNKITVFNAKEKTVLPGFIDSHTHFVFGGYRHEEFSWRLAGDDYMRIMKRGGGILSTVRATQKASKEELFIAGLKRLDRMLSFGVTTVEGKSGYGLNRETEIKQLEVMADLNKHHPVDVVSTFLGAHAVPQNYKDNQDGFIDFMIKDVIPQVADQNLAEFCDIFCEAHVFSVEQSRRYLTAALELGLKPKFHADEMVQLGGAELAAELNAVSADHLLRASDQGLLDMAKSGVVATLLPATAFGLREPFADARSIIDKGLSVALSTDFNPGSCFTLSIPLIISLSTLYMKMTPEEAITALTLNGAAALNRAQSIGSIDPGKKADLIICEYPSYHYLPYHMGMNTVGTVFKNGIKVFEKEKGWSHAKRT